MAAPFCAGADQVTVAEALSASAAGVAVVPGRPMISTVTCPTDSRSDVSVASRIV